MKSTTFGRRLTEVRKLKKLSQDELAKKLDVRGAIIGRYERDEVKPSISGWQHPMPKLLKSL